MKKTIIILVLFLYSCSRALYNGSYSNVTYIAKEDRFENTYLNMGSSIVNFIFIDCKKTKKNITLKTKMFYFSDDIKPTINIFLCDVDLKIKKQLKKQIINNEIFTIQVKDYAKNDFLVFVQKNNSYYFAYKYPLKKFHTQKAFF